MKPKIESTPDKMKRRKKPRVLDTKFGGTESPISRLKNKHIKSTRRTNHCNALGAFTSVVFVTFRNLKVENIKKYKEKIPLGSRTKMRVK